MVLMFLSCGQVDQEKPENLIGEEKMSDLIFELALFDASKGFVMKGETARIGLNSESFYKYHNIDNAVYDKPTHRNDENILAHYKRS